VYRILFVDRTCPHPYDGNTLAARPQGGSESSLTRVAEALARRGHRVRVTQHNRPERAVVNGVEHTPLADNDDFTPTHVVAFRDARILARALEAWPGARGYAWFQDFPNPGGRFAAQAEMLARHGATVVLVSRWHRRLWTDHLGAYGFGDRVRTRSIYNAIPDDLGPDATPVDRDKLVFFSSPHKGLRATLEFFARFADHPELADMRLHVANPGYAQGGPPAGGGRVVELGALPWKRVIEEVRSAFLVLHYNAGYPETFGLVHAEADAVGTPWISGSQGANPEVCSHPDELADLSDPEGVLERIARWRREGRIHVEAGERFRISRIASEWEELFGIAPPDAARLPALPLREPGDAVLPAAAEPMEWVVERDAVEAGDTSGAEAFLAGAGAGQGRVELRVAGYEGDPREPWEIPEVRAWLRALDEQGAAWFWHLSPRPDSDGLLLVTLALCEAVRADPGRPVVEPGRRAEFLAGNYRRFHGAAGAAGWSDTEMVRGTQAVARYFAARLGPTQGSD
jgi:hypothetical protein